MRGFRIAIAVALAAGLAAAPIAADEQASPVDALRAGKQAFESACGTCHAVDLPLSKLLDRAGWEETFSAMAGRGATIDPAERGLMIEYLAAKSSFETRCITCHDFRRAFGLKQSREQWEATVDAMVSKKIEAFTTEDITRIKAYLTLIVGAE